MTDQTYTWEKNKGRERRTRKIRIQEGCMNTWEICVCVREGGTRSLIKANHHATMTAWDVINCSYSSVCARLTHDHTQTHTLLLHAWPWRLRVCDSCSVLGSVCLCSCHLCIYPLCIILLLFSGFYWLQLILTLTLRQCLTLEDARTHTHLLHYSGFCFCNPLLLF